MSSEPLPTRKSTNTTITDSYDLSPTSTATSTSPVVSDFPTRAAIYSLTTSPNSENDAGPSLPSARPSLLEIGEASLREDARNASHRYGAEPLRGSPGRTGHPMDTRLRDGPSSAAQRTSSTTVNRTSPLTNRQHSRSSPAVPVLPLETRASSGSRATRGVGHDASRFVRGLEARGWDADAPQLDGPARTFEEMVAQINSRDRGQSSDRDVSHNQSTVSGSFGRFSSGPDRMPRQFTGRIEQRAAWQPDEDVAQCTRCNKPFSMLIRRHHCRKCGRVVCNSCSQHRIQMPKRFIAQPPGYLDSDSDVDRDGRGGEELEVVRVCAPCVPDPNYGPPPLTFASPLTYTPLPQSVSARVSLPSHPTHSTTALPSIYAYRGPISPPLLGFSVNSQRNRGNSVPWYPGMPVGPRQARYQHALPALQPDIHPYGSLPNFAVGAPFMQSLVVPSASRIAGVGSEGTAASPSIPPERRYNHLMSTYAASEKDVSYSTENGPTECVICLGEFEVGEELALLECFCKFHRGCIVEWWDKGTAGSCPTHKLRE